MDRDPASALSLAYYAMLYAARGALSERDKYAKTHKGTWHLFREEFVKPGLVDAELVNEVQDAQEVREQADYEAWLASSSDAQGVIELAGRVLEAVDTLLSDENA
jgi:uncharacterized protein (UPF0332 family)